jgi:hypothetical protein
MLPEQRAGSVTWSYADISAEGPESQVRGLIDREAGEEADGRGEPHDRRHHRAERLQRMADQADVPAHVDRVLSKPPKLRELKAALVQCVQAARS